MRIWLWMRPHSGTRVQATSRKKMLIRQGIGR